MLYEPFSFAHPAPFPSLLYGLIVLYSSWSVINNLLPRWLNHPLCDPWSLPPPCCFQTRRALGITSPQGTTSPWPRIWRRWWWVACSSPSSPAAPRPHMSCTAPRTWWVGCEFPPTVCLSVPVSLHQFSLCFTYQLLYHKTETLWGTITYAAFVMTLLCLGLKAWVCQPLVKLRNCLLTFQYPEKV